MNTLFSNLKFLTKSLSLLFILSFLNFSYAATYSVGKAEVDYTGWSVSKEVKEKAITEAKKNAIKAYFTERSESDAKRFDTIEPDVFSNLDWYLINSSILGDAVYSDRKKYSVTVQVQLNLNRLNQQLVPDAVSVGGQKPEIAFFFITRELIEQQKFDDRIYKRVDASQSFDANQNNQETIKEKSNSVSSKSDTKRKINSSVSISSTAETGGSVTSKASKRTYKVSSSSTFNAAFLERLTSQDWPYEPIELETEQKVSLDSAKKDFANNEEIQPSNLQKLISDTREAGFKYLALGTLNVSLPKQDAELGLQKVSVEINAKVYEIDTKRVKTILTVKPTLVSGFDQDEIKAQSKAIREAAFRSASEFLSQLSNKQISN